MTGRSMGRGGISVALVGLFVAALLLAVAVIAQRDDDGDQDEATTTTAAAEPATTTATAPSTAGMDSAVFPFAQDEQRFDDPITLAEAFAERVVGFVDPVYSELRQGDARSGEIGVRPTEGGPETILLVRQLEDDTWWVLGAVPEGITLDEPAPDVPLTSLLVVSGQARAPQGTMEIELWTDAADEPLASATATVGGDRREDFEVELDYPDPATRTGALYLRTRDDQGAVWEAAVLRVRW